MQNSPTIYKLENLIKMVNGPERSDACINGKWVPARPLGLFSLRSRLKAAWLVFTGRADAVEWEGQ